MGEVFYFAGIALTLLAVAVSFFGLRNKDFPPSRGAMLGGISLFALLVVATAAMGVINAEDEQETRENEQAADAAEEATLENEAGQAEDVGEVGGGAAGAALDEGGAAGGEAPSSDAGGALELTAPEDGSFAFDPDTLEAGAGEVTLSFTNPASIEHDVHVEQDGEELAASDLIADGDSSEASAELEPGEYVYYCSVPGHREGGMEGTLTVE